MSDPIRLPGFVLFGAIVGAALGCGGTERPPTDAAPTPTPPAPVVPPVPAPPVAPPKPKADPEPVKPAVEPVTPVEPVYDLTGGKQFVHCDGDRVLVLFNSYGQIRISPTAASVYDLKGGKPVGMSVPKFGGVCFSTDGRRFLVAEGTTARVCDTETGQPVGVPLVHPSEVWGGAISPDGKRAALGCADGTVHVWHLATGKPAVAPKGSAPLGVKVLRFSPDGTKLAFGSYTAVRVCDVATGEPVFPPISHKEYVTAVQFSTDGARLLTLSMADFAQVWDAKTGKAGPSFVHDKPVTCAVFSPDGKRVATGSTDNTARVWDAATGAAVTPPLKRKVYVGGVAFDPTGERLATAGGGENAIWDIATAEPVVTLKNQYFRSYRTVSFSPDGRFVVMLDGFRDTGTVYDAKNGKELIPNG